jgi:hypothetical protein
MLCIPEHVRIQLDWMQLAFRKRYSVDRQRVTVQRYGLLAAERSLMLTGEYSMFP